MAADGLRALAMEAITAAKDAGATYADVRVAEEQQLQLNQGPSLEPGVGVESRFSYGIRVMRDGVWAFVHGSVPSADALAVAARQAMATVRGYTQLPASRFEWAPTPVATGEWATPIHVDPFTVPLQDHSALIHAYHSAMARVHRRSDHSLIGLLWLRETRVFGSTEGSLVTQRFWRSISGVHVGGSYGGGFAFLKVPGTQAVSGGYETAAIPAIQDEITRVTEEAVRLASLPARAIDVGRYPVVFDGSSLGMALAQTIGPALDLDRALGYEADASGTSFLSPPMALLGTTITSPLLSVTATRALPALSAVKWDDDGVEPQDYSVIQNGTLVDYHTSRQTAPALRDWYAQQKLPLRSHGCAAAPNADGVVLVQPPHLSITPGTQTATLDDLCRDMGRGILIRDAGWFGTDQQLASGAYTEFGHMFEIEQGKVVRRIVGNGLQFMTSRLWKSLVAVGDAGTVRRGAAVVYKGQPWTAMTQTASAPAALCKDVDVISTQVRL
jgi:TldD protein